MIDFKEHFNNIHPGYFESMTDEEFMLLMYYGVMPTKGKLGELNTKKEIAMEKDNEERKNIL